METAFGWLGDIFRAILRAVPQIVLVNVNTEGLKYRFGSDVIKITSNNGLSLILPTLKFPFFRRRATGIHVVWPLTTEYYLVPIKRQTTNLVSQYLCTADKHMVGLSGIVVYEISDVEKLLTECYDYEDTIRDYALAVIKKIITEHDFDYLQDHSSNLDVELTHLLRSQLKRFGVRVIKCTLSDFSSCFVLGLWNSN